MSLHASNPQSDSEPSEPSLVAAARRGDRQALGTLLQGLQSRLYNSLLRLTGSPETAQDLVQETFVQALTKIQTFRGESQFFTWLYRIAFNLAMSGGRRRRPQLASEFDTQIDSHRASDTPDELAMRSENVRRVQAAIAALDEAHRTVVVLREIDGCDYQQIGDILGVPVGTVRSRLFRARLELRNLLADPTERAEVPTGTRLE